MKKNSLIAYFATFSAGLLITFNSFAQDSLICTIKGKPIPEYKYKIIKTVKAGKNTYGSVTDIQRIFARKAIAEGAEAVINYNAAQRFGFFPWRFVRPVITGTAITWDKSNEKPFSCEENGGVYL